uniref:Uncharacterized protein n=1 Tax=Anguilla anguilla TaxID=7936 RepID=A0A0E9RVS2_ANGAN
MNLIICPLSVQLQLQCSYFFKYIEMSFTVKQSVLMDKIFVISVSYPLSLSFVDCACFFNGPAPVQKSV